ncbi:DUF1631 family protein [Polaromonas sp.]|uniref:DUF1631 family protein n=1 Tax=Polaromonas sp. TaxID=1869339 RepID=UPI00184E3635|nr:DUF1631 family protein [Polaromonas sp.]NML84982.1 DUF1631 domain-containing protein [Polaromonas sp.]
MTTSSQETSVAYQSCLEEGLSQSSGLIQRWCSKLVDALYMRSMAQPEATERRALQDAVGVLKTSRVAIELGFVDQLATAIADDTRPGASQNPNSTARSFSALSFDQLELMGDNQVQEAVESARLQQVVKLACEAGLAGFSGRLSSAQGFQMVKADKNPMRPEVVSQALFKLLRGLSVTSQTRARWLSDGAQLLGDELQALYVSLDDMLAAQGITPAAYGVIASPENRGGKSARPEPAQIIQAAQAAQAGYFSHAPQPGGSAPEVDPDQSMRKQLLTLDNLHHLLVGDYDSSFNGRPLPSGYDAEELIRNDFAHTIPAALDVLVELEEKGIAPVRAANALPGTPLPLAQMRAHLKTDAKSLGQSLAIEVVGLMIEQLANDSRLLVPVRQVIIDAEPAFLRLAVTDPRFFSDKRHPARRLLEVITNTSLAYAGEEAPGFAEFMHNLRGVAALLTEEHASDAQHFATLLQDFENGQARNGQQHREAQSRAVRALLQAEQRNLLAVKIASEIRVRSDFVVGNRIIRVFLTGPWSQVMAKERLLGDYGGAELQKSVYSRTLGDLLWSLNPAQVSHHRKRLLKIIPDMLESLREGLLSIDYPLALSRPFFDELMVIHQAGLRALPAASDVAGKRRDEIEKMFSSADEFEVSQPWLAPSEAQHSGFMEDMDLHGKLGLEREEQALPDGESRAGQLPEVADEAPTLHLGDWVELLVDMQWLRAQLTWISPHDTLFLFTSEGGRKHSMTARVLQHLLQLNLVKVVSQQGVVDGALDSVARTALRNSLDGGATF